MSDFRIKYGSAYGPYGSAGATSAQHLLPPQDTTPDVSLGTFFVTNNTSAVTYTYFDVTGAGGIDSTANNGKVISILFQDNNTTIANALQLFMAGTQAAFTSGQTVSLIFYNSAWYQYPFTAHLAPIGREAVKTVTVAGTVAPNVAGVSVLVVNATAAATLVGLSGGVIGQEVTIAKAAAAAGTGLTLQGAANFWLAGTTAIVTNDSATYRFICDNGTRFRSQSGLISP